MSKGQSNHVYKEIPGLSQQDLINLKEYLAADFYGNSKLSRAIEQGKIDEIRIFYPSVKDYDEGNILNKIASDLSKNDAKAQFEDRALDRVGYEIRDRLNLIGEDTSDLLDGYGSSDDHSST